MRSRECLELAILEYEKETIDDENNQWVKNVLKGLKQIKQDLDRLEQLEKENQGLKEAINILKEVSSLNCDKTLETERQFLRLTQKEYELLKEVFESVGGENAKD